MPKYFPQPEREQSHFSKVPAADIERSRFDRSHGHKTTMDVSYVVPIFVDEVLPGDSFDLSTTAFARLATPLKPIMDNLYLDTHFFFVPNRLVWDGWQEFMGERSDYSVPAPTKTVPHCAINIQHGLANSLTAPRLAPYFGLPFFAPNPGNIEVNALPFRGYRLIWNEWFRDQNQQPAFPIEKGDDCLLDYSDMECLRRNKRHDYFTSALPWPQKGDPVFVPLGVSAPIISDGSPVAMKPTNVGSNRNIYAASGSNTVGYSGASVATQNNFFLINKNESDSGNSSGMMADLAAATAMTINDLRTAFQIQRLLERDARGGTRYIEIILSHFGVHSEDSRLQRPEFLGAGSTMVNINPVAATFANEDVPQGQLAAYGTVVGRGGFSKSFTEHGFIIGVASIRSEQNYQFGVHRQWLRETRYDYYWPALAHLGEQAIYNTEIYATGNDVSDFETWGYQERYAEYRYKPSIISGLFNSNVPTSLDVWHLAQDFSSLPPLNGFFLIDLPAIDRCVAVPSEPDFLLDIWFNLKCSRAMPVYSVPGLIDHF